MLALFLAVMAAAWLIEAADDNPLYHPHGAVAFIRTGERTPLIAGSPKLSALGAQQMHTLGQMFRGRYINGDNGNSGIGQEPIIGLSADILNDDQLSIQTLDEPYLVASAQAFMQGLYPPYTISSNSTGHMGDETGILANGSVIDYPLSGYQYANIKAFGSQDLNSIYVAGDQNCYLSGVESSIYQSTDEYLETKAESQSFYEALNASLFDDHLPQDQINYYKAFEIYDYLSYAYMHDRDVYETLANDTSYNGVYSRISTYADESAWYSWGNTSSSSSDDDLRAMAGKTAAAMILGRFQEIWMNSGITTNGNSYPLTLLFGEHQPLISLFSLMLLDYDNDRFRSIPPFSSTIIFELFSTGSSNEFPSDANDLWVNFYYHNGTEDYNGKLTSYPIFGRNSSAMEMPWIEFQDMMSRIMVNTASDWCTACNSGTLFCMALDNPTINLVLNDNEKSHSKLSPAVAGVIGAVVTLAVAGLLFAVAMLVGGIRFHRVERNNKSQLGGFKGSRKLASDADLSLPKNGVAPAGIVSFGGDAGTRKTPHERIGSWELRQKEFGPGAKGGALGEETVSRRESMEAIEAAMSRPVEPTERV